MKVKLKGMALTDEKELDEVLQEYLDVLNRVPGLTDAIVHKIDTGDSKPIRSLPYRLKLCPAWRQQVRQDISSLLEGGIIGTCVSPWASPIVPISYVHRLP